MRVMCRTTRALFLGAILGATALAVAPQGAVAQPETRAAATTSRHDAASLSGEPWRELRAVPFRPEWVGGTLVYDRPRRTGSLSIFKRPDGEAERIHWYFLSPPLLFFDDETLELEPCLAKSLPALSAGGLVHDWVLRDDITWEDGVPLTTRDVVFSFRMLSDARTLSARGKKAAIDAVASVEALDDHRFRVTWRHRYFRAVAAFGLDFPIAPAHALPDDPDRLNRVDRHPTYGPYRVVRFDDGELVLELRPEYRSAPYPTRPFYVETFRYHYERDRTRIGELLRRDVLSVSVAAADQLEALLRDPVIRERFHAADILLPQYSFIGWNNVDPADPARRRPHPLFGDPRVRRAMTHLVPRDLILSTYYHGRGRVVTGPFDPRTRDYDGSIAPLPFAPDRARALLAEAGFSLSERGFLERDGRPLRFTLLRPAENTTWVDPFVTQFVEKAGAAGITVDVERVDFNVLIPRIRRHDYDAMILLWSLDWIDPDPAPQWHSGEADREGDNVVAFRSAAADRVLDRLRAADEPEERHALNRELHRILDEEQPCTFLLQQVGGALVSRQWANVRVHKVGLRWWDFVKRDLWN